MFICPRPRPLFYVVVAHASLPSRRAVFQPPPSPSRSIPKRSEGTPCIGRNLDCGREAGEGGILRRDGGGGQKGHPGHNTRDRRASTGPAWRMGRRGLTPLSARDSIRPCWTKSERGKVRQPPLV